MDASGEPLISGVVSCILFGIMFCLMLVHGALLLVITLTTVRRLLADPRTRNRLGLEVHPWGGLAINIGAALCRPRRTARLLSSSPLPFVAADVDMLLQYTTPRERRLAKLCYASMIIAGTCLSLGIAVQRWTLVDGMAIWAGLFCTGMLFITTFVPCWSAWNRKPVGQRYF